MTHKVAPWSKTGGLGEARDVTCMSEMMLESGQCCWVGRESSVGQRSYTAARKGYVHKCGLYSLRGNRDPHYPLPTGRPLSTSAEGSPTANPLSAWKGNGSQLERGPSPCLSWIVRGVGWELPMGGGVPGRGFSNIRNVPVTPTPGIFLKSAALQMGGVLPYKWEAYCSTNGRRIAGFPFLRSLEARKVIGGVLPYFLGQVVGVGVSETLPNKCGYRN